MTVLKKFTTPHGLAVQISRLDEEVVTDPPGSWPRAYAIFPDVGVYFARGFAQTFLDHVDDKTLGEMLERDLAYFLRDKCDTAPGPEAREKARATYEKIKHLVHPLSLPPDA